MKTEAGEPKRRLNYDALVAAIRQIHEQAQAGAAGAVNRHLVLRNWFIGAYVVEYEQNGEDRATYGGRLLKRLAEDLRRKDVGGTSPDMLERMRLFYAFYPQVGGSISAPTARKFGAALAGRGPRNAFSDVLEPIRSAISAPPVRKSATRRPPPLNVKDVTRLSWTHLVELVRIADPWKRAFYENECLAGNWSKRQLQRQIGSLLYERTGLSTDKKAVINRGREQAAEAPSDLADLIRDPYILEFAGLAQKPHYAESDLETALLDHLGAVSK